MGFPQLSELKEIKGHRRVATLSDPQAEWKERNLKRQIGIRRAGRCRPRNQGWISFQVQWTPTGEYQAEAWRELVYSFRGSRLL